ncbi:MAG: hypothetical protein FWC50_11675 [Planctomycetaceae bacterium]|nr:hypothetical protein [Planctomycetaceae bacterium]
MTFCLALLFSGNTVFAQGTPYKARPVDKAEAAKAGQIAQLLQGGNLGDTEKTTVDNYLKNYFFARWTDEANAADMIKYRRELNDLIASSGGQGKTYILAQSARYLTAMAGAKTIYPACRYNAMLALGELDVAKGQDDRPVPYPEALPMLVKAYQKKDAADMTNEAVRLAAILGIRRHVLLGIADENVLDSQVLPLLTQLALDTPHKNPQEGVADEIDPNAIVISTEPSASSTSEPQRTIELQDWFRLRAIQALGALTASKNQDEIIQTLLTIIEDPNESPVIRYEAAFSLSKFNLAGTDPAHVVAALLAMGIAACDDGISYMMAQSTSQQTMGGTSGMGMSGGMGMSSGGMSMSGSSGMMSSGGGGYSGMTGSAGGSMGQAEADQINNSIARIKYGFSPIIACATGPNYKSGGGLIGAGFKDEQTVQLAKDMMKSLQDCITYLEKGDPDAARRARAAGMNMMGGAPGRRGSSSSGMMGPSGSSSGMPGGMGTAADVKNMPKVTKVEIDQQLKKVKNELTTLQSTSTYKIPEKPKTTRTPSAPAASAPAASTP